MPIISGGGGGGGTGAGNLVASFDSTLGADTASFDWQNIPATSAHVLIYMSLRGDVAAGNTEVVVRFNNDSGANYWTEEMHAAAAAVAAAGVAAGTGSPLLAFAPGNTAPAAGYNASVLFLPDYASGTRRKTCLVGSLSQHADSSGNTLARVGGMQWVTAAAVTRITVLPSSGANWKAGSRMTGYLLGTATS